VKLDDIAVPKKSALSFNMPMDYVGHQLSGNVLIEQVRAGFSTRFYQSEFFYLDMLNMNFTGVQLYSPNAKMLSAYSSQIKN